MLYLNLLINIIYTASIGKETIVKQDYFLKNYIRI